MKTAVLVILLVAIGVVATLIRHPEWVRIDNFAIEVAETSVEDVLFERIKTSLVSKMQVYEGKFFWDLPLKTIQEMVARDKRVKRVSVYREFPSKVRIEIEPHTPVLAYLARDGRIYPVARDATLLPPLPAHEATDMPILRGEDLKDEPLLRESAIELLTKIPDNGLLTKRTVSEIIYSRKDGFKVFASGPASEVQFGDTDFGPKISRVQKVLSYLESQNIKGRVIDARFTKKVVVRVRNTP